MSLSFNVRCRVSVEHDRCLHTAGSLGRPTLAIICVGCDGSCPAVEQVPECFLDGFAIQLSLRCEKQAGSRFDLSPRQPTASVLSASCIAAEEACPCGEASGNEGKQCCRDTGIRRCQSGSSGDAGEHCSGKAERDVHDAPKAHSLVGAAFSTLRFDKHAFDFGPNRRHLPLWVALMLRVVSSHEPKALTGASVS